MSIGRVNETGAAEFAAYFGDLKANVYAVDAFTGKLLWQVAADPHALARVTGAPRLYNGRLYVHLGIAAAAAALGVPLESITAEPTGVVRLGHRRTLRLDADGKILIDFVGGDDAVRKCAESGQLVHVLHSSACFAEAAM